MKSTKLLMGALALAGAVALSSSARAQTNTNAVPTGPRPGRAMGVDAQLDRLDHELKLTDEQKPKVKAALEEQRQQMQGLRDLPAEERRAKFQTVRDDMDKKMKGILTDAQYKTWKEMGPQRGQRPRAGQTNNAAEPKPGAAEPKPGGQQ